jgi:hypothetical protein
MISIRGTYNLMKKDPENRDIYLMDFVDRFRYHRDMSAIQEPFEAGFDDQEEAVLAGVVEYLCDEIPVDPPEWTDRIPACRDPYFRHGMESLKAISVVESPLRFRIRKVFVLENFLDRV